MTRRDRLAGGLSAFALAVVLELVRGHADWGPSEGVYALTSRLLLDGGDLYGGLVASQPPWVYLFGAIGLAIHDSIDALRLACGCLQVVTGLLAAEAVWRLTANRVAAILVTPLVMVTPWAVHQHGLLLPEQLGAPLLLGAALLASQPRTARWAGILAAVAVFTKLPFLLPAVALVVTSPARATAARWALGALVAQAALFTALFGADFWRQIVQAQQQAGEGLELQIGSWVQAGWNLAPLLVCAAAALALRGHARDRALLGTLAATTVALLATVVTIVKPGTGLNVLVPSEPLLATLAVAGAVWALSLNPPILAANPRRRSRPSADRRLSKGFTLRVRRRSTLDRAGSRDSSTIIGGSRLSLAAPLRVRAAIAGGALLALLLAQSASLLVDPANPRPFHRPLSASPGWKAGATRAEMRDLVAAAERCPSGSVYTGPQLVAFIAGRRVPGDQPDAFIIGRARMHAAALRRLEADGPPCP